MTVSMALLLQVVSGTWGQAPATPAVPPPSSQASTSKYVDQVAGKTVDALVSLALDNNGELAAMKTEAQAGEALVKQARLRANPTLEVSGTQEIRGMGDKSLMGQTEIPLELGGRRSSRILVADRELRIRQLAVSEKERQLAADVRTKFGEGLTAVLKLKFTEDTLSAALENYNLVVAKVNEGRTPPLEQNQEVVELNRVRAMREIAELAVETKLLELRNLVGMSPEEPLRLKGDLEELAGKTIDTEVDKALLTRPDLLGARAVEDLSSARIEQAKSEGRIDADVMLGYQRMKTSFPLLGVEETTGGLSPIENRMNFFTFGVKLMLPVRNRNQGMIAAAQLELEAARSRTEFGRLTIRREVAAAKARYERSLKAKEIVRVGVRDQASANLNVVRETYELGSKTLLDYISELRRFIDTENGYIDSLQEAYSARIDLLKAVNAPELTNK